jgi:hypothetical protein
MQVCVTGPVGVGHFTGLNLLGLFLAFESAMKRLMIDSQKSRPEGAKYQGGYRHDETVTD